MKALALFFLVGVLALVQESLGKWLKKQYDDIKGHLKWAIVLLTTGAMTWVAHYVEAYRVNIASWLNLALPIFAILAVVYLSLNRPSRREATPPTRTLTVPPPPVPPPAPLRP